MKPDNKIVRLLEIKTILEQYPALFKEHDELLQELNADGETTVQNAEGKEYQIIDLFKSDKTTFYKTTAVKRFELKELKRKKA